MDAMKIMFGVLWGLIGLASLVILLVGIFSGGNIMFPHQMPISLGVLVISFFHVIFLLDDID